MSGAVSSSECVSAVERVIRYPRVGPAYEPLATDAESGASLEFQVFQIAVRDLDAPLLDPRARDLPAPFSRGWASHFETLTHVKDRFFVRQSIPADANERVRATTVVEHRMQQDDVMPPPRGSCVSVWLFGRTQAGRSVAVRVTGWRPVVVVFVPTSARREQILSWVARLGEVTGLKQADLQISIREDFRTRASRYEPADPPASSLERKRHRALYLGFPTLGSASHASALLRRRDSYELQFSDASHFRWQQIEVVEKKVSQVARFCAEHELCASDWVSIPVAACDCVRVPGAPRRTWRQHEVEVDHLALVAVDRGERIAPFTVLSHDIETFANNDRMPDETQPAFPVINYNVHAYSYGADPADPQASYRGGVILSAEPLPDDSARMLRNLHIDAVCVPDERDLLDAATRLLIECHADITLGYNTTKYDNGYLAARADGRPRVRDLRAFWMRSAFILDVADVDIIEPPRSSRAKAIAPQQSQPQTTERRSRKNMVLFACVGSFDIDAIMHARAHKKMSQYDMNTVAAESGVEMSKVKLYLPGAVQQSTQSMLAALALFLNSSLNGLDALVQRQQLPERVTRAYVDVAHAMRALREIAQIRELQEALEHGVTLERTVQEHPASARPRCRAPDRERALDHDELIAALNAEEEEEQDDEESEGVEEEEEKGMEEVGAEVSCGAPDASSAALRALIFSAIEDDQPAPTVRDAGALEERLGALRFTPTRPTELIESAMQRLSFAVDSLVAEQGDALGIWGTLMRGLHSDRAHLVAPHSARLDAIEIALDASGAAPALATAARSYLQTKFLDARAFLGNNNYRKLFALHRLGPVGRALNCVYCAVDVEMPLRIMMALTIIPFTREQSAIARVQMSDVGQRGQQHKGYNKLFVTAFSDRVNRFVLDDPYLPVPESQVPYPGGAVQDPIPGLYGRSVTLDFAQLYPSIMQAFNLSPDTMLPARPGAEQDALVARMRRDAREAAAAGRAPARLVAQAALLQKPHFAVSQRGMLPASDAAPGVELTEPEACSAPELVGRVRCCAGADTAALADVVEFHMLDGELKGTTTGATGRLRVVVAQHVEAITTTVLRQLTAARKKAKLELKTVSDDDPRYDVLDARQLALKLLANALYGFFGVAADKALYACMIVSATVCLVGRNSINSCAKRVDRLFRDPVQLTATVNAWYRDVKRMPDEQVVFEGDARDEVCTLYGDTDSIMVGLPGFSGEDALKLGLYLRDDVNALFPPPMVTELEKLQQPVWFSDKKKCYAFMKRVPDDRNRPKPGKLETKGLDTVRRDRALIARETQSAILKILLDGDPPVQRDAFDAWKRAKFERMYAVVTNTYVQMAQNLLPLPKYVRTMQLAEYADAIPRPHVSVVQLLQARGAMERFEVGDRVPFVHVVPARSGATCMAGKGARKNLAGARVLDSAASHTDHPTWMLATGENETDRLYYGGQIVYNPVIKVLGPLRADGFPSLDPLLAWFRSEVSLQITQQRTIDGARASRLELSFDQRRAIVGASFSLRSPPPSFDDAVRASASFGSAEGAPVEDAKRARTTQSSLRSFFGSGALVR